jgi:prepilin-type N-terminal cleavage/methylation domain-containing protein
MIFRGGENSLRSNKGFTLIEILIILSILAILSTMFAVSFTKLSKNSNVKDSEMTAKVMEYGLSQYFLQADAYPANSTPLAASDLSSISADTIQILQAQMTLRGIGSLDYNLLKPLFKKINPLALKPYFRLDATAINNYFFIDLDRAPITGYTNELAGMVFSYKAYDAADGTLFSGKYKK